MQDELKENWLLIAPISIALDRKARIQRVNRSACEALGFSTHELIGQNWFEKCIPSRERHSAAAAFRRFLEEGENLPRFSEDLVRTGKGEEKTIAWQTASVKDAAGEIVTLLRSGIDITERTRSNEQDRSLNRLLQVILEVDEILLWEEDLQKLISHFCRKVAALTDFAGCWILLEDARGNATSSASSGVGDSAMDAIRADAQKGRLRKYGHREIEDGSLLVGTKWKRLLSEYVPRSLAIRLVHGERTYGHLGITMSRHDLREKTDLRMFKKLAADLVRTLRRHEMESELLESEKEVREQASLIQKWASAFQDQIEEERKAISRQVHDEIGQNLTAIKLDLVRLADRFTEGPDNLVFDRLIRTVDDTYPIIRQIGMQLRPPMLDDLGLFETLLWWAETFGEQTGIDCLIKLKPGPELREPYATAIYRLFREILTNISRHSGAEFVIADLSFPDRYVRLRVFDNGRGITPGALDSKTTLGLVGIQERIRALNGTFKIRGSRGRGTFIKVTIPLEQK